MSGTRIYIPGETTIAEQLRKRSFECGIYAILVYISAAVGKALKESNPPDEFAEIQAFVEGKFFNLLEMQDLEFNLKVVKITSS